MGAYLRGLKAFTLTADDTLDEVLESGQKIQLTKTIDFQVSKPDGLHAAIITDRKARELFYDGANFTILEPETRYFVTVSAPPTIRELVAALETKYGIEFPLIDLFEWGARTNDDVKEAMVVGKSLIAGQMTDHYAFRQDDIDWQIWIAEGDAPLPLRYVIVTKDMPGEPQYMANLSWNTEVEPDDAVFAFSPTDNDHPIAIVVQDDIQSTP